MDGNAERRRRSRKSTISRLILSGFYERVNSPMSPRRTVIVSPTHTHREMVVAAAARRKPLSFYKPAGRLRSTERHGDAAGDRRSPECFFKMGFMRRRDDAGLRVCKKKADSEESASGRRCGFKFDVARSVPPIAFRVREPEELVLWMLIDMGYTRLRFARDGSWAKSESVDDRLDNRVSRAGDGRRHRQRHREPHLRKRRASSAFAIWSRTASMGTISRRRSRHLEGTAEDRIPQRDERDGADPIK